MKNKITPKRKRQISEVIRLTIQLLFFIFLPSAFTSAFSAIKYIFTQMNLKAPIELTSFVIIFIALCTFTIVFGRFFCGFACSFGALGDILHTIYVKICKKLKRKPLKLNKTVGQILSAVKYLILTAIVLLCFFGVYNKMTGWSPWDVFSMIRAGYFKLATYVVGVIILALLLVGMTLIERFFCRFFCPLGAIFSLLPILPFFSLHRNKDNCIKGCSACQNNCPADISLEGKNSCSNGNCFQCQKCTNICPKKNIGTSFTKLKGNEIWFTIFRAIILAAVLIWAGV